MALDNVLPGWGPELSTLEERSMPNQQWAPERAQLTSGTMLPARLRMLVAMTKEEVLAENPIPTFVCREVPVEQKVASQGIAEAVPHPFSARGGNGPSPLGRGCRGVAPPAVLGKGAPPAATATWSADRKPSAAAAADALSAAADALTTKSPQPLLTVIHDADLGGHRRQRRRARLLPEAASRVPGVPIFYGSLDRGDVKTGDDYLDDEDEDGEGYGGGGGGEYGDEYGDEASAGEDAGDWSDEEHVGPVEEQGWRGQALRRERPLPVVDVYVNGGPRAGGVAHHELVAGAAHCRPIAGPGSSAPLPPPPEALPPSALVGGSGGSRSLGSGSFDARGRRGSADVGLCEGGLSVLVSSRGRLERKTLAPDEPVPPPPRGVCLGGDNVSGGNGIDGGGGVDIEDGVDAGTASAWGFAPGLPEGGGRESGNRTPQKRNSVLDFTGDPVPQRRLTHVNSVLDFSSGAEGGAESVAEGAATAAVAVDDSAWVIREVVFSLGSALGLELEYDAGSNRLVVFACRPGGQASAARVATGAVVLGVRPWVSSRKFFDPSSRGHGGAAADGEPLTGRAPPETPGSPEDDWVESMLVEWAREGHNLVTAQAHLVLAVTTLEEFVEAVRRVRGPDGVGKHMTLAFLEPKAGAQQPLNGGGSADGIWSESSNSSSNGVEDGGGGGGQEKHGKEASKAQVTGGGGDYDDGGGGGGGGDGNSSGGWRFATGDGVGAVPWLQPVPTPGSGGRGGGDGGDEDDDGMLAARIEVAPMFDGGFGFGDGDGKGEDEGGEDEDGDGREGSPAAPVGPRMPLDLPLALGRSVADASPVSLLFANQSPHLWLDVGWVGYDGEMVWRASVGPGQSHLEASWASHPWVVAAAGPPRFDPLAHASRAHAERAPCVRSSRDPCLVLRAGAVLAASGVGAAVLWQPRARSLAVSARDRAAGRLSGATVSSAARKTAQPAPVDGAGRVRRAKEGLVAQLRSLRDDPSGGANGGRPPTITLSVMATLRTASVFEQG